MNNFGKVGCKIKICFAFHIGYKTKWLILVVFKFIYDIQNICSCSLQVQDGFVWSTAHEDNGLVSNSHYAALKQMR